MDLMNFKLLKEDGENYHLEHPSGKRMSVAKALLSAPAKKAIEKMCSGGEVKGYADGGSVLDDPSLPPVDQGQAGAPQASAVDLLNSRPSVADMASASVQPGSAPMQQQAPQQPPMDPMIMHGMSQDQLLTQEQGQVSDLAKAQEAEAGAASKIYSNYNSKMDAMKSANDIAADNKKKNDALMQDYLDHKIKPDDYVHNMGTGSKIAAGISMIFGGLGQGLIGGKNPGIEWLHNAIQNDIESQKNDQTKRYNLWQMNREAMGDDMKANIATQNQMWTGVQAKIAQAAAAAQGPVAKFRAQQTINDIEKQKIQNSMTLGLLSQGQQGGGQFSAADPSQLVPQMVPKELQPKVYEEIGKAQNIAKNKDQLLSLWHEIASEQRGLGGVMRVGSLGYYESPKEQAFRQLLEPNFRDVQGQVRKPIMDQAVKDFLPTGLNTKSGMDDKLAAFSKWMESESAAPTAKGNFIDLSRFQSTSMNPAARLPSEQQQIYNWAKAHPNTEKGQMALQKFKGMGIE